MRFHLEHGKNISFDEQRFTATRINSFSHAMVFSERPLHPGEIFLIEIQDTTDKWAGHIKIGFTSISPNEILERCIEEVVYDHILHITVPSKPILQRMCTCGLYRPLFNFGSADDYIYTPYASVRRQELEPVGKSNSEMSHQCPTSIGSRIGVLYALKYKSIHMHSVINGFDYGPFAILNTESPIIENDEICLPPKKRQRTFPNSSKPINQHTKFWAFVDVYGATTRVRIVQLYGPSSLRSRCRSMILSSLESFDQIDALSLNNHLKLYLKFHVA
ncbi:unnamed protein product [Adineta ricciae]|uniref:NHR domain-containing protein n=1 Tax=Adineta ricciae TaxID=249248 RepID=A0A814F9A0_ADIRI|nr:unnamed protein product [Adineta ricciae]